ncbi:hypothetical protein Taro_033278 [Colocasia esculenta]|uniref:Uncharacterized protein n=1 Tax=Colocasia esculenta TaxID=4460 RepID=A0A843VNF3_COLES|nr:hypothetical protein [Colocasia esculenta]
MSYTTCWGLVEECWVAGKLWIDHKKHIFFLFSSASACANRPLGVDQRRVQDPRRVSGMKAATLLDVILTFPDFAGDMLTGHGECPRAPV